MSARAELDAALVSAVDHGLRSPDLRRVLGGMTHATFWRRVKRARESQATGEVATTKRDKE